MGVAVAQPAACRQEDGLNRVCLPAWTTTRTETTRAAPFVAACRGASAVSSQGRAFLLTACLSRRPQQKRRRVSNQSLTIHTSPRCVTFLGERPLLFRHSMALRGLNCGPCFSNEHKRWRGKNAVQGHTRGCQARHVAQEYIHTCKETPPLDPLSAAERGTPVPLRVRINA